MKSLIDRKDRDFVVCSDCHYFEQYEIVDEQYPYFKRGNCLKYNKIVDNLFEVKCEQFKNNYHCQDCRLFSKKGLTEEDIINGYDGICNIDNTLCCFDDNYCTMFQLK